MLADNLRCYFGNKVLKRNISEIVKQIVWAFPDEMFLFEVELF